MTFPELVSAVRGALEGPLPGPGAQCRMAPRPRPGWYPGRIPEDAREGAGLILLYPLRAEPHLLLTLRRAHLPMHGGQVSLPGGAREPGESLAEAALREAEEEVGLDRSHARVMGILTPLYIPASGFVIHPVMAHSDHRPDLRSSGGEVARILEVPLGELRDPSLVRIERRTLVNQEREVPYFDLDGEKVWGATAMILAEFLWLVGDPPDPWGEFTSAEG